MKKKKQLLKVEEILLDENLYPRIDYDEDTVKKYAQAMKMGSEFPEIIVAKYKKKYYLVDGKHRLEAYKLNDEEFIQTEVLLNLTDKQIFLESIKRNVGHGRPFSDADLGQIKWKLEKFELTTEQISEIIRIPVNKLIPIVAEEMDSHYDKDFFEKSNEPVDKKYLITTQNREINQRKQRQKYEKIYSLENFIIFIYKNSKTMQTFLLKLETKEFKDEDLKIESGLLLEKVKESEGFLKDIENRLKKIIKENNLKVVDKEENSEERMQRLLDQEQGDLNEEFTEE